MAVATSWISKTPDVCGGEPCMRATRHTVSGVVNWKNLGLSDEQIIERHPDLTLADLEAAWDYYAHHRDEIDEAIRANAEA